MKYIPKVYRSGIGARRWYATIEMRRPHTYHQRTAYGVRRGWKYAGTIELGAFPTQAEARVAVKARMAEKRDA